MWAKGVNRAWVFVLLVLLAAACARPTITVPEREVPVTEEAAQRFEEKLLAFQEITNGEVKLTFSEAEVTSYIRLRLLEAQRSLPVLEPTIWFSGGNVYIAGQLNVPSLSVSGDAVIVLTATVEQNRLQVSVRKALIAGVPVPRRVLQRLSDLANDRMSNTIGPITIRDLQVLEGEIIVVLSR